MLLQFYVVALCEFVYIMPNNLFSKGFFFSDSNYFFMSMSLQFFCCHLNYIRFYLFIYLFNLILKLSLMMCRCGQAMYFCSFVMLHL
jgi:hypothetical protein